MVTQTEIDALKAARKNGVQVAVAPQLFETPRDVARSMAGLADLRGDLKILEPSAGTGRLVDAIIDCGVIKSKIFLVEENQHLSSALAKKYGRVYPGDFLERCGWELGGPFDRILMNPPFERGADIKHVLHALEMLKPGGILVGICAGGPRQKAQIEPLAAYWEELPPGTFKNAGTMVNSVLFTIEPEAKQ